MNNVNISIRLLAAFLSLTLLIAAVSTFSLYRVDSLRQNLETINGFNSIKQRYAINFRGSVHDRAISVRDVTLVESGARMDQALTEIATLKDAYAASAAPMDELFASSPAITDSEVRILNSIKEIEAITVPLYEEVVRLGTSGQVEQARTLLIEEASPAFSEWLARINQFIDLQESMNAEITARVEGQVQTFSSIVYGILALGGLIFVVMGLWCATAVRKLGPMTEKMRELANGDLSVDIPTCSEKNEIAEMARALAYFKEQLQRTRDLEAENEQRAAQAETEKRETMRALADSFEENVNGVVSAVSAAAEQMHTLSKTLSTNATRAGESATTVAAASTQASTNVETVAAATEEMTHSISEVSQRVTEAASMTEQASSGTMDSTASVSKLSKSAQTIGDVIAMISAIAEQTNLLALNATIEAARAGDAGKGFAVVAGEVKALAEQTAKATDEISGQITTMQNDTNAVVGSIEKIGSVIQDLNATSSSIAAAIDEQHSATQEIARNTQQAADGTRSVSQHISDVSLAVEETNAAATDVMQASSQLVEEAGRLEQSVSNFLERVRAA